MLECVLVVGQHTLVHVEHLGGEVDVGPSGAYQADGSLVSYTEEENPEHFSGAVCSLGCLGAMASITLRLVPAFNVKQRLYRMVPLDGFIDGFREMVTSIDSFSAFVSPETEEGEGSAQEAPAAA